MVCVYMLTYKVFKLQKDNEVPDLGMKKMYLQ